LIENRISSFLSLRSVKAESKTPVPAKKVKQLGELCVWLYGSKKADKPPVVESQNPHLKQLDAVLKNREAIAALRADEDLAAAFEISRPPTEVFEESLLKAKRELLHARAHLTTGFDNTEGLLRIAGTIASLADDIYEEMKRKLYPGKKTRITEK